MRLLLIKRAKRSAAHERIKIFHSNTVLHIDNLNPNCLYPDLRYIVATVHINRSTGSSRMKYLEAKETLQHALDNQSTIRISKLKQLMAIIEHKQATDERARLIEVRKLHKHIRKIKGIK